MVVIGVTVPVLFSASVSAARYSSTGYIIDASIDNSFGGQSSATDYKLTASSGEAIVGNGSSGSYIMARGYTAQLARSIQVNVSASALTYASLVPNVPQTASYGAQVQTDAAGYSLAIAQNANLTSGANTIGKVSGTIASPSAWVDGTTTGLGFTLTAAPGGVPAKWNSGAAYAQLPNASTVFFAKTGKTTGTDTVTVQLKLGVNYTTPPGTYTNTVTTTGTVTP